MDKHNNKMDEETEEHASDSEPPRASDEALNFLAKITEEDIDCSIFKDNLVTISEDKATVGEFTVSVERVTYAGDVMLLVHATSSGKIENIPMGTSLTAYINNDLTIVEQQLHEFVKIPKNELEKNTHMKRDSESNSLIVKRHVTQGDETRSVSHVFDAQDIKGLITEGSNLLLQRLLAKADMNVVGELQYITIDPDSGKIFPGVYKPLPDRTQVVNKQELFVRGIERHVLSAGDLPCTWQSFYMDDGHLTLRVQVGSPSIATLRTVPQKVEREQKDPKPIFPKKPLDWEEDEEMHSMFLERKEALKADHFTYMREHPDAQALLADFFQFLLLRKPDDVVKFAGEYFASFSALTSESSPYLRSDSQ